MTDGTPVRWTASTVHADMWVDPADDPRDTGTPLTDERGTLEDYLRAYRLTLEMKCAGLDAAQLTTRSVPPSTMSLLGLVRHLADVERYWFRRVMAGETVTDRYPDEAEWAVTGFGEADVTEAWQAWREEVAFADALTGRTALDTAGTMRDGSTLQLREVLVHMIEEYARHAGHADLLRERIDGRTGQ